MGAVFRQLTLWGGKALGVIFCTHCIYTWTGAGGGGSLTFPELHSGKILPLPLGSLAWSAHVYTHPLKTSHTRGFLHSPHRLACFTVCYSENNRAAVMSFLAMRHNLGLAVSLCWP